MHNHTFSQKNRILNYWQVVMLLLSLSMTSTGSATVLIGGDSFDNAPYSYMIGQYGQGTLLVDGWSTWDWNGSSGTQNSSSGVIMSRQTGSSATGLITGAGSAVNVTGNGGQTFFQVGRGGTATLDIKAGGSLNLVDYNSLTDTQIDRNPVLVIGGSGTDILPTDGTGTLTTDNGHIRVEGIRPVVDIGDGGGNGTLIMNNGSTLQLIDHGPAGSAETLTKVGARSGSTGQLYIDNSTFNMTSDVGRGRMHIGMNAGSLGYMQISNGGQLNINGVTDGDLLIGFGYDHDSNPNTPNQGGTGIVQVIGSGSSITTFDKVIVGSPLQLSGGGFSNGSLVVANGASINAGGGVYIGQGGVLGGDGTINGNLTNDGGVVSMGNSPGTLTVNGDYSQLADSILEVEINGNDTGEFDVLNVLGDLDITGGIIDMIYDPGFLSLLSNDTSLMPNLHQLFVSTGDWNVDTALIQARSDGYHSVALAFDSSGQLAALTTTVPAPATLVLLGMGLLMLCTHRKYAS